MSLSNKVILIGGLGRDAELKKTGNGTSVCSFSVACEDSVKQKDGSYEKKTEWVNCISFGKTAEAMGKYLRKGSGVIIEGKLQTSSWDDKNGGSKRYKTEVFVERWMFQKGGKPAASENNNQGQSQSQDSTGLGGLDDDMPF